MGVKMTDKEFLDKLEGQSWHNARKDFEKYLLEVRGECFIAGVEVVGVLVDAHAHGAAHLAAKNHLIRLATEVRLMARELKEIDPHA